MTEELPKREKYQQTRTKPNIAIQKPESIIPSQGSLATPVAVGSHSKEVPKSKSSHKEKMKKAYSPGTDPQEVELHLQRELQIQFPLSPGNTIDAKDKRNQWYTGKILKREKGMLLIHFDGWDPKEDITIYEKDESRYRKFRTVTRGPTLPRRTALKLPNLIQDNVIMFHQKISEEIKGLTQLLKYGDENTSGLQSHWTAERIVHFLRGTLLFYSDAFFFSAPGIFQYFKTRTKYLIGQYLDALFQFITQWMVYVHDRHLLEKYVRQQSKDPEVQYESRDAAIACSEYEISILLSILCGEFESRPRFAKEQNLIDLMPPKIEPKLVDRIQQFNHHLSESFYQQHAGLQATMKMCGGQCPLDVMMHFFRPLIQNMYNVQKEVAKNIAMNAIQVIENRLDNLYKQDLEQLHGKTEADVSEALSHFSRHGGYTNQMTTEMVLNMKMRISLMFIKQGQFSSKIQGLKLLNVAINQARLQPKFTALLIKFIQEQKILEWVLGRSVHPEIIKRTEFIFQFLLQFEQDNQQFLDQNFIDSLWTAFRSNAKNDDFSLGHILVEITKKGELNLTEYIIRKLQESLPEFENLSLLSSFVKDMLSALDTNYNYKDYSDQRIEHVELLIDILESLMAKATPDAKPMIEMNMGDAMKNIPPSARNQKIYHILEKMKTLEGLSSVRTLNLWIKPKRDQENDRVYIDQEAIYTVKPKFHNLLLNLLQLYLSVVKTKLAGTIFTDSHLSKQFVEGCPHEDVIESFFVLLQKLILFADKSRLDFGAVHFKRLFKLAVVEAPTYCEQDYCFKLFIELMEYQDKSYDKSAGWLLPQRFQKLFSYLKSCKLQNWSISTKSVKSLVQVFMWVNIEHRNLIKVSMDDLLFRTICTKIDCLNALWKVGLVLADPENREIVFDVICSIYLNADLDGDNSFKTLKFQKKFLSRCLNFKGLNSDQALNQLELLAVMLDRYQGGNYKEQPEENKGKSTFKIKVNIVVPEGDVNFNLKSTYIKETGEAEQIGYKIKRYEEKKIDKEPVASFNYEVSYDMRVGQLKRRIVDKMRDIDFMDLRIKSNRTGRFLLDFDYISSAEKELSSATLQAYLLSNYEKSFALDRQLQNEMNLRKRLLKMLGSPEHAISMRAWDVLEKLTNNDYQRQRCWVHALNGFEKKRQPVPERVEVDDYQPRLPSYSKDAPSVQSNMQTSLQVAAFKNRVHQDYKPNMELMNYWEKILLKGLPFKLNKQTRGKKASIRVMLFYLKFLIDSIGADVDESVELYDPREAEYWKSQASLMRGPSMSKSQIKIAMKPKQNEYLELQLFSNNGGLEFLVDLVFLNSRGEVMNPVKYMMLKNIFVIFRHYLIMMERHPEMENVMMKRMFAVGLTSTLITVISDYVALINLEHKGVSQSMLDLTLNDLGLDNFYSLAFYVLFKIIDKSEEARREFYTSLDQVSPFEGLDTPKNNLQNDTIKAIKLVASTFRDEQNIIKILQKQFIENLIMEKDPLYHLKSTASIEVAAFLLSDDVVQISEQVAVQLTETLVRITLEQHCDDELEQDPNEVKRREHRVHGCAILLEILFREFADKMHNIKLNYILHFYLDEALFKEGAPICRSPASRGQTYIALLEVVKMRQEFRYIAIKKISSFHFQDGASLRWRTHNISDWSITNQQQFQTRAKSTYSGLRNLGCTCYMNSLLQQFYMLGTFREAILALDDQKDNVEPTDNLLTQLKRLYIEMHHTQSQWCDTLEFAKALKDPFEVGGKLDIAVQKDASQFLINFIDQLEEYYRDQEEGKQIDELLKIDAQDELTCQECKYKKKNQQMQFPLSCRVGNMQRLEKSLADLVKGEMLEDNNALFCQTCDKKTSTLKRLTFKYLPNVLVISLNRFGFNFDNGTRFKVNERLEFKRELNMKEYTSDYIFKTELQEQLDNGERDMQDLNPEEKQALELEIPDQYFVYELSGVVVHEGSAEHGHYFSYIREDSKWYEFNDKLVRPFDSSRLEEQTFGGYSLGVGGQRIERSRNAYILIYKRKVDIDKSRFTRRLEDLDAPPTMRKFRQDSVKVLLKEIETQLVRKRTDIVQPTTFNSNLDINVRRNSLLMELEQSSIRREEAKRERLMAHARKQNKKFWEKMFIFTPEYQRFLALLLETASDRLNGHLNEFDSNNITITCPDYFTVPSIGKLAVVFYLTVVLRSKDMKAAGIFHRLIKMNLSSSEIFAEWFLFEFSKLSTIEEFLIFNRKPMARTAIEGLIHSAWRTVKSSHSQMSDRFSNAILYMVFDIKIIDGAVMPQGLLSLLFFLIRQDPEFRQKFAALKGFQWLYFLYFLYQHRISNLSANSPLRYTTKGPIKDCQTLLRDFQKNKESMELSKIQKSLNVIPFLKAVTLLQMKNLKPLIGTCLSDVYAAEQIVQGMKSIFGCLSYMCRCHPYQQNPFNNSLLIKPLLSQVDNVALAIYDDLQTENTGLSREFFTFAFSSKLICSEVGKMFAYMSFENKDFTKSILRMLSHRRAADMNNIQVVLQLLSYQFQIKDSFTSLRFDLISEQLIDIFRGRSDAFGSTTSYYEKILTSFFVYKTYLQKELFRLMTFENDSLLKNTEHFLIGQIHPPDDNCFTRRQMAVQKLYTSEKVILQNKVEGLREIAQLRSLNQVEEVYLSEGYNYVDEAEPNLEELTRDAEAEQILYFNEKTMMWTEAQVLQNYLDFLEIAHANEAPAPEKRRGSVASNKRVKRKIVNEILVDVRSQQLVLGDRDLKISIAEIENIFNRLMSNRIR